GGDLRIAQAVEAVVGIGNFVPVLCFIDQGILSLGDDGDIFDAVAVEIAERSRDAGDACEFTSKLFLYERIVDSGRGRRGGLLRGGGHDKKGKGQKKTTHRATLVSRPRGG